MPYKDKETRNEHYRKSHHEKYHNNEEFRAKEAARKKVWYARDIEKSRARSRAQVARHRASKKAIKDTEGEAPAARGDC